MRARIRFALSLLASSTLAAAGCAESSPTLDSLSVTPSSVTLSAGKTEPLTATARYSDGTESTAADAEWKSSAPAVATVSDRGVVTAVAAGTARVTATKDGKSGTCTVTVSPPALTGISASPASLTLSVGGSQTLTISGSYDDGSKAPISSFIDFSSSNTGVATVDGAGLVKAVAAGTAVITVAVSGKSTTIDVAVSAAALASLSVAPATVSLGVGETANLTATGTFDDSSQKDLTSSATWTSSDEAVAKVDEHGVASAIGLGQATITAAVQGKKGEVAVTVHASTEPKVFVGDFGPSETFQGFGGAANAVEKDETAAREGRASLKAVVPASGYTGGAIATSVPRDLSSFNAVTFWAKASKEEAFDTVGLGNDNGESTWSAEIHNLALTTEFKKFIVPIPLPSKATSFNGLFHFATAGKDYTVWFNDIQYEKLDSSVLNSPSPAIATETVSKAEGTTATVNGAAVTFTVNGAQVTVAPVKASYFTFTSSDSTVASVDASGTVSALKAGTATITAKLGDVAAAGALTVEVTAALAVPTSAAAAPTAPASDVVALYSATYSSSLHAVNTWRTDWTDGRTALANFTIGDHAVMKYSNLYFFGVEFTGGNSIDATSMAAFHLDVFTSDASEIRIKLVDFGADNAYGGGDDTESELTFDASSMPALAKAQWVALEIPFTAFTAAKPSFNRAHLSQLVISGSAGSTLYLDNVYFHK